MKKLFTYIITMTLLAVSMEAQAQGLKLGVTGGLNINQMKFDRDIVKEENCKGWFAGLTLDFTIPVINLSMDISAVYDKQSVNVEGWDEDIQYVDVPINVKYFLGIPSKLAVFAATGPQFSFNLGDDKIYEHEYKLKSSYLSWNIGAGVRILGHLQAAYRYNIGIGDTAEHHDADGIWHKVKNKNGTHHVALTYFF